MVQPDVLAAAASEAAAALSAAVPVLGTAGPAVESIDTAGAAPDEESRAVTATVAGATRAEVVIVVSSGIARALEDGPLGAQDLTAVFESPLLDAMVSLEPALGGPVRVEAAQSLAADLALTTIAKRAAENERSVIVVPFVDGDASSATLVVAVCDADAVSLPDFDGAPRAQTFGSLGPSSLELIADVEMNVTAELGRTRMTVRDLLSLSPGAVVELDRAAGSVVDLLVNGKLIARGEVVVVNDEFGVRISEIIDRDTKRRP